MGDMVKKISIFLTKVLAGLIFSVLLIFLYSAIQYLSGIGVGTTWAAIYIAVFVGAAYSGFLNAEGKKSMGWFAGMLSGIVFALLLICISTFFEKNEGQLMKSTNFLLECMFSGIVGGVIGINMGRSEKNSKR